MGREWLTMSDLSKANAARLEAALSRQYMSGGKVMPLRSILEARGPFVTDETDGMIDYSRTKFNRMNGREQEAYMAALRARRLYFVNDIKVPKIVYEWARECAAKLGA